MPISFDSVGNTYLFDGWDVDYLARINDFRPVKPTKAPDVEAATQTIIAAIMNATSRKILVHLYNEGNILPGDILDFAFFYCEKNYQPDYEWWVKDVPLIG